MIFSFFRKNKKKKAGVHSEKTITALMEATGWPRKKAVDMLEDARKRLGISDKDYLAHKFYDIPVDEQADKYEWIKIRRNNKKNFIKAVMETTGWSEEEAIRKMDEARKTVGSSYYEYYRYSFHKLTPEEQKAKLDEVHKAHEEKEINRRQKREDILQEIMRKTGWDHETARKNVLDARHRTHCTFSEYNEFKFYELDNKMQESLYLRNTARKISYRYDTNRNLSLMLFDKQATNEYLAEYVRRPWIVNTDVTLEEFKEKFKGCSKVFYKPLGLNGGRGAEPFDISEDNIQSVYEKIRSYDKGVVEKYVVQHPKMTALSPTAVNTIRFVTLSSDVQPVTRDGKDFTYVYVMLKMGGPNSVVDNLHAGGVAALIDFETGTLRSDAIDQDGNILTEHPVTGTKIKGFEIPYFKEAAKMVEDAVRKYHLVGHLGWDVCIEEDGPSLIELNVYPGTNLITLPTLVLEHRGVKEEMEYNYLF